MPLCLHPLRRPALLARGLLLAMGVVSCVLGVLLWREWRQNKLDQALITAVRHNDTTEAIALLEQGADANTHATVAAVSTGKFLWDCFRGRHEVVDVNSPTPLQTLFADEEDVRVIRKRAEPVELVRALLAHGANVQATDAFRVPPVVYAYAYCANLGENNARCVELLLEAGADVNAETRNRRSLLLCAIQGDDLSMAKLLLRRGAKCQIDGESVSAIQAAKRYENHPEMLALLRKYGCKD